MSSKKGKVLSQFKQVYHRPDTWVGSVKTSKCEKWVWDFDEKKAVQKKIRFNPGLFNIIREIGSNAIDNKWRSEKDSDSPAMKKIVITIETGEFTFWNDGYCIPVKKEKYTFDAFKKDSYTMKLYPSEVFFGKMGSGTNFDDSRERKTSGRNGMGSKLTNIFSTEFEIEHVSPEDKSKFVQKHWDNGSQCSDPKITKSSKATGYTQISFTPDYGYFKYPSENSPGIDDDLIGMTKMYAYEIAMITGLPVIFNKERVVIKNLEQYARLFYPNKTQNKMARFITTSGDECVVVEGDEPEADIVDKVAHVSFVNGIRTPRGGIHVKEWELVIVTPFVKFFNTRKPKKGEKTVLKVTGKDVKPYLTFFLKTEVDKPEFGTQTKDELTGPEYKVSRTKNFLKSRDLAFKQMLKWNFIFLLEEKLLAKADRAQKRTEGTRRKVSGKGVTDANKAGTKESYKCILCVTEGLSAKTFADRGIGSIRGKAKNGSETSGHDCYGTLAVRGKFMNVQNKSVRDINANVEIQLLKKVLGLRHGVDYSVEENFQTLRYGKVWILTDADDDGIHIRGLLINFFYREYPKLVERKYLVAFNTAVVRASSGPRKKRKNLLFYSNPEFRKWFSSDAPKPRGLDIKYYKGLGSINPKDAPGYFKNPKMVTYFVEGDEEKYMNLGFDDQASDERKMWITRDMSRDPELDFWFKKVKEVLTSCEASDCEASDCEASDCEASDCEASDCEASDSDSGSEFDLDELDDSEAACEADSEADCETPDSEAAIVEAAIVEAHKDPEPFVYEGELSLSCFVDQQLIIYHRMALRRSLPGVWDGLKEGQRKILYAIRVSKFRKTWDLERVSGMVKTVTSYHHGAISLQNAIIKMGQGFVGSNNIPLLVNDGEFGTRAEGGADRAEPRYPSTMLEEIVSAIFPEVDDALLERLVEDNEEVEYSTFIPVIPMLLINGAKGVASGYSTDIPCYNPTDVVEWIEMWLEDPESVSSLEPLKPWYRGFTGDIELTYSGGDSENPTGWISKGTLEEGTSKKDKGWWHIRELPVGTWTNRFKEWLEYLETGIPPKDKKWKKSEVKCLSTFKYHHTANTVHFMIKPTKEFIPDVTISQNLKNLQKNRSLKNMVAIDEKDYPYRFGTPEELLECFCHKRLGCYSKRKAYLLALWNKDLSKAKNRYRFIEAVGINRKLDLHSFEEEEGLYKEMTSKWKFDRIDGNFDYLLGMQVRSLTRKKADTLKKEQIQLEEKISNLKSKTPKDLWKEDLVRFKAAYKKFQKTRCEE